MGRRMLLNALFENWFVLLGEQVLQLIWILFVQDGARHEPLLCEILAVQIWSLESRNDRAERRAGQEQEQSKQEQHWQCADCVS